jgi:hypothetical protein
VTKFDNKLDFSSLILEIDVGISGAVAEVVGKKLKQLSPYWFALRNQRFRCRYYAHRVFSSANQLVFRKGKMGFALLDLQLFVYVL